MKGVVSEVSGEFFSSLAAIGDTLETDVEDNGNPSGGVPDRIDVFPGPQGTNLACLASGSPFFEVENGNVTGPSVGERVSAAPSRWRPPVFVTQMLRVRLHFDETHLRRMRPCEGKTARTWQAQVCTTARPCSCPPSSSCHL